MTTVIRTEKLSKWYGNVLGLNDVSIEIEPGITGLLGPNGAGKSTFMKLITGQLRPNIGTVSIDGARVRNNPSLFSRIGFCPEQDAFYDELSGWEFVNGMLRLHHFGGGEREERARRALEIVELWEEKDRGIRSYSRGMRQRLKFARPSRMNPSFFFWTSRSTGSTRWEEESSSA